MGYPLLVLILPHASSNWDPRLLNKICKYLESKILTWSSFATSRGWLTAESIGLSGRFIQFNYYYLFYIHESPAARCCNFSLSTVNNNHAGNYVELSSCKDETMFQNLIVVIGRDRRSIQQHFQLVVLVLMNKGLKDVATHIELYWQLSINDLVL